MSILKNTSDFSQVTQVMQVIGAKKPQAETIILSETETIIAKNVTDATLQKKQAINWTEKYLYIRKQNKFLKTDTKEKLTKDAFNMVNGCFIPETKSKSKQTATTLCMNNGYLETVYDCMYAPLKKDIFKLGMLEYANIFNKNSIPKADKEYTRKGLESIEFIKRHIKIILPQDNGKRADFFIDWIAHQNQNIGVKIRYAVLIQSTIEGMGKSLIYVLLKILIGQQNIKLIDPKELRSEWSDWAKDSLINVLEELMVAGHNRYEVLNELKPLITNSEISVRERNIGSYTVINPCNYLIFTNHKNALPLGENDSRYWVNMHPIQTKEAFEKHIKDLTGLSTEDYFNEFLSIIETQSGQLKKYFLEHEISDEFKKTDRAPMTAEKKAMIMNESQNIKGLSEARELLAQRGTFYNQEVFSPKHLFNALSDIIKGYDIHLDDKEQKAILNKLGYLPHNAQIKIDGEVLRFRTNRVMTNEEIRESLKLYNSIL
jgi:hypothetical protein